MGQISGVNASSITSIAGVAVANISYVGPTSAATIGLGGGGGKIFSVDSWPEPGGACMDGPAAAARNPQTLYYNSGENRLYTDAGFTSPFSGNGWYYWNQTDTQWWGTISPEGAVEGYGACG